MSNVKYLGFVEPVLPEISGQDKQSLAKMQKLCMTQVTD